MKKCILIAIATALALSACSNEGLMMQWPWLKRLVAAKPDPNNPLVYVDQPANDVPPVVIVDQEPDRIKVQKNGATFQQVDITFYLQTAGYTFPSPANPGDPLNLTPIKGTSASDVPLVTCKVSADQLKLVCYYVPKVKNAYFHYTISVQDAHGHVYTSDPSVMND